MIVMKSEYSASYIFIRRLNYLHQSQLSNLITDQDNEKSIITL